MICLCKDKQDHLFVPSQNPKPSQEECANHFQNTKWEIIKFAQIEWEE